MRRREFLSVLGSAAVWPLAARAQEPGRTYRLGDLHLSPRNALYNVALFDAVKPAGFLDGIPGLGPTRKKRLVKELGGVNAVRNATLEELLSRSWLPDAVGLAVYDGVRKTGRS